MPADARPSKLPDVGVTIFTVMSALAAEHGAINLSQGFPDFECDPALSALVSRHMNEGRNQYAPMQGVASLRRAIAAKYLTLYGASYDADTEVTVTSGATEALFDAVMAYVQPGDEVIVFEPCYDSYVPAIRLAGGRAVFVGMQYPSYRVDWDEFRRALTPRTRMVIVNTPHNPSGTVWGRSDVAAFTSALDGSDVLVLSDEVYEHIVFDGVPHLSFAREAGLRERSLIVGSFGKTFHTTGWKIGYCVAPAELSHEFRKVHQFVTFTSNTPTQHAIADYLANAESYRRLPSFYQEKRDTFLRLLDGSRWRPLPSKGSYFQLLDYAAITDEPDQAFAMRLTSEHGVAAIPTSAFLHRGAAPPVLRFCFAKRSETLARAAERLARL